MQISRNLKNTLTLILGTVISFLMVTLLVVMLIAPNTWNLQQIATFTGETVQKQPEIEIKEEIVQTETVQPRVESNKTIPVVGIAIVVIVITLVAVGAYYGIPYIKNRIKGENIECPEEKQELHEESGHGGLSHDNQEDINVDELDYQKSPEELTDIEEQIEPKVFDYYNESGSEELNEEEGESRESTNGIDEIEPYREIERLTCEANKRAEAVEKIAIEKEEEAPYELIKIEEYEELPADVDELKQEEKRLKNKINQQIDYIEKYIEEQEKNQEKNQAEDINNISNNGDIEPFLIYVTNAFRNMQRNGLVYNPRGKNNFTYIPSAEFFDALSKTLPNYKMKNVVEALKQHEIIPQKSHTSYNGKRVLKIIREQFMSLTTEINKDAGT